MAVLTALSTVVATLLSPLLTVVVAELVLVMTELKAGGGSADRGELP
jgi:hypothetical protein